MNSLNFNKDFKHSLQENKTEVINKLKLLVDFGNKLEYMPISNRHLSIGRFFGSMINEIDIYITNNIKNIISKLHEIEKLIDVETSFYYTSSCFYITIKNNIGGYSICLGYNNSNLKERCFKNCLCQIILCESLYNDEYKSKDREILLYTGDFVTQFIESIINN